MTSGSNSDIENARARSDSVSGAGFDVLKGGGEMGARMRAFDWSKTPIGPVAHWPQSLRVAIRILLGSGYPMVICWGPGYTMLYNDAYRPVLGRTKHPGALGLDCQEVFREAWNFIGPLFDKVMTEGQNASTLTDQLFLLDRNHYLEECYYTFSYSPIPDDDGKVGGVFVAALETTERVIEDRRMRTLRDLASRMAEAKDEKEVLLAASATLGENPLSIPFSLLYLYRPEEQKAYLTAASGSVTPAMQPSPCDCALESVWPFATVLSSGHDQVMDELQSRFAEVPITSWGAPPKRAAVIPILLGGHAEPAAFLVAGINPRREFDEPYRQFLKRAADQIATGIAGARAYAQERQRAEALADLDRAKTFFFSNVSYEFRTSLTLILGPLDELLANARERLSSENQEQLAVARGNALRLLKLVNTLLDFSRMEASRGRAAYEPTDLSGIMADARREAGEREARLRAEAELERHRLEELLAHAPALIGFLSGPEHRWTYVNDLYIRVTGRRSAEDFLGKSVRESLPELATQGFFELLDEVYRTGRSLSGKEMKMSLNRSASGQPEEAYFDFMYQPVRDAEGRVDGILVHAVEVTDEVAARKTLEMNEERLRLAQTAAQIGTWEWDPVHNTRTLSPELHRIFGTDAGAPQRKVAEEWASRVHPPDWQRVQEEMAAGSRSGSMEFEYRYQHPEHGLRWFYCKGSRLNDESRILGVVLDITGRKRAELRAAAQDKVNRALAASADLLQAAPQILRAICEVLDWNMGVLWVVDQNSGVLRCLELWLRPECNAVRFAAASRSSVFSKGIGLPGRVWASAQPLWVPDVLSDSNFPRLESASREELHAAFGFPLLLRDQVSGVLEFFSDRIRQPDDALLRMMALVGGQIGQYIERLQAEEALRDSEERYRTMAETASDAILSIDEQNTILFANSATMEVFGYRPEELIGKKLTMLMPDSMRHVHEAGLRRYIETGQKHLNWDAAELPGLHKSGREIPLEVSFGEYMKGGKHFFTGFARDVSGRRQVEESRQRLAAIVESSSDAIISKDLKGIVTSWNAAAERMFGYKAEEMIGRSITVIIPPELQHDEQRILETIGRGERIDQFETVRVTKSGERIDVSLTASPIQGEGGRITGAAKIARDITQRKKTERVLRTTERLASVGRLAATVAHEINNPLEAVTNLVYLARNNTVQENVREYLSNAEIELERISHLTKQTLGFYRETRGASLTRVGLLVESLLSVFSSRIRNKAIEIRPEIRQDPEIVAVPGEIRQLLANLLGNSMDAVGIGGLIRLRVSTATAWRAQGRPCVRLTVADSGPGIPPALRSKLFEPFFTTKEEVGTGLGLWVCKSIVEKHGGSIRVRSRVWPARSWTAFSVLLPLKSQILAAEEEDL